MNIQEKSFKEILPLADKAEGLVLLGAGGDLKEWVVGVTKMLKEEGISPTDNPKECWGGLYKLTTTGGRIDLVMMFKAPLNMGKLAMWRIRFGGASWLTDYVVNYDHQH